MLSNNIKGAALAAALFTLPTAIYAGLVPSQDSTDYQKIGYTGHNTDLIPTDFFRVTVSRVFPRGDKLEPDPHGVRISIDRQQPGPLNSNMQLDNYQVMLEHEDREWHKIQAPFLPYELGVKIGHPMWKMDKMSYEAAGDGIVFHYADVHAEMKRDVRCHIGGGYRDFAQGRCKWRPKWGCGRIWHCDLPAYGEHAADHAAGQIADHRRDLNQTKSTIILPAKLASRSDLVHDNNIELNNIEPNSTEPNNTEPNNTEPNNIEARGPLDPTKWSSDTDDIRWPDIKGAWKAFWHPISKDYQFKDSLNPKWWVTDQGARWPDVQGAWDTFWAPLSKDFQYKKARSLQERKLRCDCKGHRKCRCVDDGQPPVHNV